MMGYNVKAAWRFNLGGLITYKLFLFESYIPLLEFYLIP